MRAQALAATFLLALLAGCAQAPRPATIPEADALRFNPPVDVPCSTFCYEPSIAADAQGRLLVSPGLGDGAVLLRSTDGGASFQPIPGPPLLSNLTPVRDDYLVQSGGDGAIWFSAMVGTPRLGAPFPADPQYYGLQVARSTDGGLTWSPNAVFQPGHRVDRQWVAVGGGHAYLTWQTFGAGVRVARSDDGGATFQPTAHLADASITGAPCVRPSGRVLFPVVGNGLTMRRSDDLGATWQTSPRIGYGAYFPALSCGPARLELAWWLPSGIQLAASTDEGETWTLQPEWTGRLPSPSVSPAIAASHGSLTVASFRTDADGTMTLQTHRLDAEGFHAGVAAIGIAPYMNRTRANTDFASMAALPDGRVALVWSPSRDAIRVAVESLG